MYFEVALFASKTGVCALLQKPLTIISLETTLMDLMYLSSASCVQFVKRCCCEYMPILVQAISRRTSVYTSRDVFRGVSVSGGSPSSRHRQSMVGEGGRWGGTRHLGLCFSYRLLTLAVWTLIVRHRLEKKA